MLTYLSHEINHRREVLYELVEKKGITDPEVIRVSQEIDEIIVQYQKVLHGLVQQGIKTDTT